MVMRPFHEGEIKVQKLAGEREKAAANRAVIKAEILGGAFNFISKQGMILLGTESPEGALWASLLLGPPGFLNALEPGLLEIDLAECIVAPGDPFLENIKADPRIATLVIELETRRRLKINGKVRQPDANRLQITVEESFPLCPKYIQRRKINTELQTTEAASTFASGEKLGPREKALIARCDTMFLATSLPGGGIDVSHRGGNTGFVKVVNDRQLRCPDYNGNGMFNSLGNLEMNKHAGALFVDFAGREALQLTGSAQALFDQPDPDDETGGTNRFWTIETRKWQRYSLPLSQDFLDYSHYNP